MTGYAVVAELLPPAVAIQLLASIAGGWLFVAVFVGVHRLAQRLRKREPAHPVLVPSIGAAVGILVASLVGGFSFTSFISYAGGAAIWIALLTLIDFRKLRPRRASSLSPAQPSPAVVLVAGAAWMSVRASLTSLMWVGTASANLVGSGKLSDTNATVLGSALTSTADGVRQAVEAAEMASTTAIAALEASQQASLIVLARRMATTAESAKRAALKLTSGSPLLSPLLLSPDACREGVERSWEAVAASATAAQEVERLLGRV